jgi:anti-sigma28 factor (negative regulator of flagellin synthesis)
MNNFSFEDYMRLVFLIKDLKRNIDSGEIKIDDEELKQEFMNDLNYFYSLFSLNKEGE